MGAILASIAMHIMAATAARSKSKAAGSSEVQQLLPWREWAVYVLTEVRRCIVTVQQLSRWPNFSGCCVMYTPSHTPTILVPGHNSMQAWLQPPWQVRFSPSTMMRVA
jgi:hypothetical protein